jgi:UMF1 family MFS transporter
MKLEKNHPRTLWGWAMYDWANSVFSLCIATAIFPIYYQETTPAMVNMLGTPIKNTALYEFAVSASFLLIAFLSPLLSGISDYRGNKKNYMRFFVWLGALSCMSMYFFTGSNVSVGIITLMLGTIGFAGSLVYYNSYLPDIATPDRFDSLSARGYSLGYFGSVILLIFNLLLIQKPEWFGLQGTGTLPSRISFLSVGVWWLLFAQITFNRLPSVRNRQQGSIGEMVGKGFKELRKAWNLAKKDRMLMRFLMAFFIFNMGVQTIMYLATLFGKDTIKLSTSYLIITVLIIQLIAIPGALFFSRLSSKRGNMASLMLATGIWVLICLSAYFLPEGEEIPFFILGSAVGLVMGGIQSTSRATYAKFIPDDTQDTASYFSLYEFAEKTGIALGTLIYGLVDHLTHNMRNSVLILMAFFILGLWLLSRINDRRLQPQS